MDGVAGEHEGGQERGGGQPEQEAVQEEGVEAVEQEVDSLEAPRPRPRESLLCPVGQGGHWSVRLNRIQSLIRVKYIHILYFLSEQNAIKYVLIHPYFVSTELNRIQSDAC